MQLKAPQLRTKTYAMVGRVLLLAILSVITGTALFAQSLDKAKDLLKAHKLVDAKTEIDKVLAVEKNQKNSEAWYNQVKIYNAIASDSVLKTQYPDARRLAFAGLKKYVEVDDKKLILLMLDTYKPVYEIYQGYFQTGANDYNTGKYGTALTNFEGAIETSSFMTAKGWLNLKIDTTSTLYAGIAAEKAGMRDTAALFYGKLADAGIQSLPGTNMIDIDKWLVDFYSQKKDQANLHKYLSLGEQQYPDDLYWYTVELDNARNNQPKDSLFSKYDQITQKFPKNHLFWYNYGVELYQYASDTSSGKRPPNADALASQAKMALAKSLEAQPDYAQAALLLGQISFNEGVDLQQMAKTVSAKTPEGQKKRADIRVEAGKKFDAAIPYFEKVDQDLGSKGKLKMDDKKSLKEAYDLLITIYQQKKVQDKTDLYTGKYNDVDKVH